jgi:[ribosomal protein S5]-alanine N-acetyltransferase
MVQPPNFTGGDMIQSADLPKLQTERLVLRRLTHADAATLFPLFSDPEVTKYEDYYPSENETEVKKIIDWGNGLIDHNMGALLGIFTKKDNALLGTVNYICRPDNNNAKTIHRAEIGYNLRPQYWGHGYMAETLQTIISYIFQNTGIDRIEAMIHPDNTGSHNVAALAGFTKEGVLRNYILWEGKHRDMVLYSLLKSEWENKQR